MSTTLDGRNKLVDEPADDLNTVAGGHAVCDLRREALVVHQEEVNLLHVVHQELLEAVREEVAGLRVRCENEIGRDRE
jgi:hypothetical protein